MIFIEREFTVGKKLYTIRTSGETDVRFRLNAKRIFSSSFANFCSFDYLFRSKKVKNVSKFSAAFCGLLQRMIISRDSEFLTSWDVIVRCPLGRQPDPARGDYNTEALIFKMVTARFLDVYEE